MSFKLIPLKLPSKANTSASGFTIVEVMVTTFVLTIGLLGMAALQTTGLNANQGAYYRSQATIAISDIIDRMRSNPLGVENGNYGVLIDSDAAPGAAPVCSTQAAGCDPNQLAQYDMYQWAQLFKGTDPVLPGARGTVTFDPASQLPTRNYEVKITWEELGWNNGEERANVSKEIIIPFSL